MYNSVLLLSFCLTVSFAFTGRHGFARSKINSISQSSSSAIYAKATQVIPDNETSEEQRQRLEKKIMSKMYNENGVAFAPWAVRQVNVQALVDAAVAEEIAEKTGIPIQKEKKVKTTVLDRGEIQTAEGMQWRMKGSLVELGWQTAAEVNSVGFTIEKRPSYGGDFQEVASYNEVTLLKSKGPSGGRYFYTDMSTGTGSWIYRVLDCEPNGKKNPLCQCFVEVQTEGEAKGQTAITIGLVAVFSAFLAAGYFFDSTY